MSLLIFLFPLQQSVGSCIEYNNIEIKRTRFLSSDHLIKEVGSRNQCDDLSKQIIS
jgi:hypothetical protein